jgi:hypothetical protein
LCRTLAEEGGEHGQSQQGWDHRGDPEKALCFSGFSYTTGQLQDTVAPVSFQTLLLKPQGDQIHETWAQTPNIPLSE